MLSVGRYMNLAAQAECDADQSHDIALQDVFRRIAAQWRDLAALTARRAADRPAGRIAEPSHAP